MYLIIPFVVVPLGIWLYLYFKSKDANTPRIKKMINTLGSTLVVMGLSAWILFQFDLNINIMMGIIMALSFGWAIYFYFFWGRNKKKTTTNDESN